MFAALNCQADTPNARHSRLRSLTPPKGVEKLHLPSRTKGAIRTSDANPSPSRIRSLTPQRDLHDCSRQRLEAWHEDSFPSPEISEQVSVCTSPDISSPSLTSPWESPALPEKMPDEANPSKRESKRAFDSLFMSKEVPPPRIRHHCESSSDLPQLGPEFNLHLLDERPTTKSKVAPAQMRIGEDEVDRDTFGVPCKPSLPKRMPRRWKPSQSGASTPFGSESNLYSSADSRSLPGTPAALSSESLSSLKGPRGSSLSPVMPVDIQPHFQSETNSSPTMLATFPPPLGIAVACKENEGCPNVQNPNVCGSRSSLERQHAKKNRESATAAFTCWLRDDDLQHDFLGIGCDSINEDVSEDLEDSESRTSIFQDILPWRQRGLPA